MRLGRVCVCFVFLFLARARIPYLSLSALIILHLVVCVYPHSSWYECLMGETGINPTLLNSGIWDGKNDSTIGNEMVSEWTDSGKWDGRKSVKVGNGNGMGSE